MRYVIIGSRFNKGNPLCKIGKFKAKKDDEASDIFWRKYAYRYSSYCLILYRVNIFGKKTFITSEIDLYNG